jgi:hypothetical protein
MMATLANVGADVAKAKPAVLDAYQIVADAAQKNAIGLKKRGPLGFSSGPPHQAAVD